MCWRTWAQAATGSALARLAHSRLTFWRNANGALAVLAAPVRPAKAFAAFTAATGALNNLGIGNRHGLYTLAITAAPLIVAPSSAFASSATVVIAVAHPSAIALGPAYRAGGCIIGIAASTTTMAPVAIMPPTIFAIIVMPLFAPIPAVMVAHWMPPSVIIEKIIAVARIPITVIPATAIAYVVETAAIVAVIINVVTAIGVAAIIVVITVAGIAQTDVVNAAR